MRLVSLGALVVTVIPEISLDGATGAPPGITSPGGAGHRLAIAPYALDPMAYWKKYWLVSVDAGCWKSQAASDFSGTLRIVFLTVP